MHSDLLYADVSLCEISAPLLCVQTGIDVETARAHLFSPEENYACGDLLGVMWTGIKQSCIEICPGCGSLLPDDGEISAFTAISDFFGWEHIDDLIADFYLYICMTSITNLITRNLGFIIGSVSGVDVTLDYSGTHISDKSTYKLILLLGRIDGSLDVNGFSDFCCEVIHVMIQIALVGRVDPFKVSGPTYMSAFANAADHVTLTFTDTARACIRIQRVWRMSKRKVILRTLGLVLARRSVKLRDTLGLCSKYIVIPRNPTIGYSRKFILDL